MSRTHKSKNHIASYKAHYKAARVRKERAQLRETMGALKSEPPRDVVDVCGSPTCEECCTQFADTAGPTRELEPFDHWAYD